jgi:hypothetical protein
VPYDLIITQDKIEKTELGEIFKAYPNFFDEEETYDAEFNVLGTQFPLRQPSTSSWNARKARSPSTNPTLMSSSQETPCLNGPSMTWL